MYKKNVYQMKKGKKDRVFVYFLSYLPKSVYVWRNFPLDNRLSEAAAALLVPQDYNCQIYITGRLPAPCKITCTQKSIYKSKALAKSKATNLTRKFVAEIFISPARYAGLRFRIRKRFVKPLSYCLVAVSM